MKTTFVTVLAMLGFAAFGLAAPQLRDFLGDSVDSVLDVTPLDDLVGGGDDHGSVDLNVFGDGIF